MDEFRSAILHKHSTLVFTSASFILALATFSSGSPAFMPMVLLIATIQVYARIFLPRKLAFARGFLLWFTISLATSLARLMPSLDALSTFGMSLAILQAMSAASSLIALVAIFIDVRICLQFNSPWAQVTVFPALWAAFWCGVSYISPLGRLAIWSPTVGIDQYSWLLPFVGPQGIDWLVGAWAVVIAQAVGAWFMGSEKPDPIRLVDVETSSNPPSRSALYLTLLLASFTIPSFLTINIPLPVVSSDTTPLIVGCVIPPHRRYKHPNLILKDFIDESKKLATADVILWPEGAITFRDAQEKDAAFSSIASAVSKAHVAVSFEEYFSDSGDSRPNRRRTGLAIIAPHDTTPRLIYYKRHLVPIAESFALAHSTEPPTIYSLELPNPSGYNKTDWAPPPTYTRPIPITASICLDLANPSPFIDLDSRPGLILAPARTWHNVVGMAMWEQAKQRASELASTILWCDGGEGGVSGIAGHGYYEVTQVGEGSWVREIALPYPLKSGRTVFALLGEVPVLVLLCLIVGLGAISHPPRFTGIHIAINWTKIARLWADIRCGLWGWRRRDDPERHHLLE